MPGSPVVSVVMPVRNGGAYLAEAVESILGQGFRDLELVIVDDGSTDDTPSVLARYGKADGRVRIHSQEMRGLVASLNTGYGLARGKYIARMDADDVSLPDRLGRQVEVIEARPRLGAIGGAFEMMDANGRYIRTVRHPAENSEIQESLLRYCSITAVVMRKQAFDDVGGYREAFLAAEDYDLWLRMAERWELANLPDTVMRYRVHPGQVSWRHDEQQVWSSLAACAAARIRRRTGHDPMAGVERVTPEVLAGLGVSGREVEEALVRRYLGRAEQEIGFDRAPVAEGEASAAIEWLASFLRDQLVETPREAHLRPLCACVATLLRAASERDFWRRRYERLAGTFPVNLMLWLRRKILGVRGPEGRNSGGGQVPGPGAHAAASPPLSGRSGPEGRNSAQRSGRSGPEGRKRDDG